MKEASRKVDRNQYFQIDHLKRDLKGRSVRGGAVTMVAQAGKFGLTILSQIVLARMLTPLDYGLVGMVTAVTGFVTLFKDLGLSMATVQKDQINHEQVSTLFWLNVLMGLATALITIALSPLIASFYQEPRLVAVTIALATGFVVGGLGVQHAALLNRQMQYSTLMFNDVLAMLLGVAAAIGAASAGLGYWSLVIMPLVVNTSTTIGLWLACHWRPGLPRRSSNVRSMLIFGSNLTGFSVINYFARNLDNVLIGRYWGAQQLGFYAKSYQMLLLPLQQINAPFASVAVPTLSRLTDTPDRYRHAYLQILQATSILTLPLVVFMIATSDWMVLLLLGPQWSEASRLFGLLGIVALVQPVSNTAGWIFITQGRTHHMLQSGAIGGVLSILSIVAGLPWGATGVALSYAVSGLLIRTPLLFWFVGRGGAVRAKDLYVTMAPFLGASLMGGLGVLLFRRWITPEHPIVGLSIAFCIHVTITFLLLLVIPSSRSAVKNIQKIIWQLAQKPRSKKA